MKTQIQKNIIIIVSAYSSGALLAPLFNGRGYTCIHLTTRREWEIIRLRSYYQEDLFADNFIIDSDKDLERIIDKLRQYNVQLIIPGCESGVSLADKLSQRFNVPRNVYEKSLARRNKFHMVEALKVEGLLCANQMKATDVNSILKWVDENQYKNVVLKPISSSSSDGVFYCNGREEIIKAFDHIYQARDMYNETNHEVLVQELLDGSEYIVNTVSRNGIHYVSDIWKGVSMDPSIVSNDSYADFVSPEKNDHKLLSDYVKNVLNALGIINGPAHSEIRLTSRGPCLIETGARLAGKVDFSVIENICGVSQISLTAEALLDPDIFIARVKSQSKLSTNKLARYVYFSSDQEGVIKYEPCFEEIMKIDSFTALRFALDKGDKLNRTSKALRNPRPGYAYLVTTDQAKLESDYQAIRLAEAKLYSSLLADFEG